MTKKIYVLDSSLRDGAQAEGISFSVNDKLQIVKALDELGVDIIEAGNPTSNPKDNEFFQEVKNIKLKHAKLASFGSTRRYGGDVKTDAMVQSLLSVDTPVVVVFGKSWDLHVTEILKTTLEENLAMIFDTISYLKSKGKEVIFDAEHFFDGYKNNPEYALKALESASLGGADCICLCDTNGGCFPDEIFEITKYISDKFGYNLGIHVHNDTGMAEANTVMAVKAGVTQIQGTLLGYGERCGNANLSTIICDLQVKLKYDVIKEDSMSAMTNICRKVAEISNKKLVNNMPFVGKSAFTHKAGMHIDGVNKVSRSFEHISPEIVGNARRFLMSEVAGKSTLIGKVQAINPSISKQDPIMGKIVESLKAKEHLGYVFEGADASLDLLIRKTLGLYKPFFVLEKFKTIGEHIATQESLLATAVVKVSVNGIEELKASEGRGPVDALTLALRSSLERFYPNLAGMHLTDYKVRIIDGKEGTSSITRVLIDSTDGVDMWTTVGVSNDIIKASLKAMVDAIEYKLLKDN